ncbi:hypothetical protein ACFQH5_15145 [Halomonas salifodinae]|uniref:Uncharacterized protein n=1 Tax=Halomonas salifodinae TaxID=438745 RepID=A0ABW2F1J2_9GAMM
MTNITSHLFNVVVTYARGASLDVISRDVRPGELLLVAQDDISQRWYSDDRVYTRYQDAFLALGRHLDELNPDHAPLTWHWER